MEGTLCVFLLACCAGFSESSNLRRLRLEDSTREALVVSDARADGVTTGQEGRRQRLQLDLSSLQGYMGDAEKKQMISVLNAHIDGKEVACVNCDPKLFQSYVKELIGDDSADCDDSKDDVPVSSGKHPNAPGYDKWEKGQKGGNFLSVGNSSAALSQSLNCSALTKVNITSAKYQGTEVDVVKARLQTLWAERRLIIGSWGPSPLQKSMDFQGVLASLAWNAPMVTPEKCEGQNVPSCGAIFSGVRQTASNSQLRSTLEKVFGAEFLDEHTYRQSWSVKEQRTHVQAVLTELKKQYTFYYQKCLAHEPEIASCDRKAHSNLLGQITCQAKDDESSDDCVYAELRQCKACGKKSKFFQYSRFHGPLALFETKNNREGLMGQCEEFSRAGHGLLSLLGYEVRYVLDFTDHVWVEVRLPPGPDGEWIHADPSEGVLDSPLMYETGWGKKLTAIFAFTPTHVEHITAKYTKDYEATVRRRGFTEENLQDVLSKVNQRLSTELPMQRWGYNVFSSKDRTLEEVALWSRFDTSH